MATSKKVIGVLPVFKGEWEVTETYSYLNRVSLYNCEFQSKLKEDNVGNAPASYNEENNEITFINTDKWLVVSDNRNAFTVDKKVDTKIAEIEKEIDDIPVDTFVTNEELETKLEDYVETTDIEDFVTETKLTSTLENYIDKITFDGCKNELNESFTNVNNKIGAIDSRIGTITIVKNSENDLVYDLKIEDKVVSSINIPKDQFLKSVDYNTETKNITFVFVTSEGEKTTNIDVSDLVDTYTAGDGLNLSDNQFSVKDNAISENKLDESVKNSIKNAYEVIEFEDPNLKTYLLDSNIGGTIIPNEITVYEAEHTTALPSFQSTSFSSLKELYYFRNVTNEPSFCYLGTREVTFYNNQLNFAYGARQSSFTKVTLVNVSSMGSMALRGCPALETVIVLGSFANMSSTVTYDNTNPTWYIQDDLYNSFITVNSNVAGEKKKLSEYYDKVQISEGTEDGTIHVSGEKGLSKDVKVTGWDELKESIPEKEELLDGGNIIEFRELVNSNKLTPGASYKVLYFSDWAFEEGSYPTVDSSPYAFRIKVTALSSNTINPEVKVLPQEDNLDIPALPSPTDVNAYGKWDATRVLLDSSLEIALWEFGNNIKLHFNPYVPDTNSAIKVGNKNPFFNRTDYNNILKFWTNVEVDGDISLTSSDLFLTNIRLDYCFGLTFNALSRNIDIHNYIVTDKNTISYISGEFIKINSSTVDRCNIKGIRIKIDKVNMSIINIEGDDVTLVNFYEALAINVDDVTIKNYYEVLINKNNTIRAYVFDPDKYQGYIELKSDISDPIHIQTYWDGTNLHIGPEEQQTEE